MSQRSQNVLHAALELSSAERAEVAVELLASLDGAAAPDAEIAWAQEVERRARRANRPFARYNGARAIVARYERR